MPSEWNFQLRLIFDGPGGSKRKKRKFSCLLKRQTMTVHMHPRDPAAATLFRILCALWCTHLHGDLECHNWHC